MKKKLPVFTSEAIHANKDLKHCSEFLTVKNRESTRILKRIFTGAIIGGILGTLAGFLNAGLGPVLAVSPVATALTRAALGIFIGGGIGGLIGFYTPQKNSPISEQILDDTGYDATLKLREEQLDISKKWVQTGDLTMHKEVFTEEKNIVVPVTREELVIEKNVFNTKAPNQLDRHTETIRIPISEERIEVTKHPVVLEDVSIYKQQFQETESFEETVKKENVHFEINGDPAIRDKETENH